jgi:3' terminal RNA ribose 2'-O-methyltransferase Hen1
MLLTITTTHRPATDLGYLLHKNPANLHSRDFSFGHAHLFYPEATDERCTAALLLDVDPVGLIRGRSAASSGVDQYVNDRPYVASSFLSTAISRMLGTALGGRSKDRPELAETAIPLEAWLSALPGGSAELVRSLFEPLGYQVEIGHHPLDPAFPEWGQSRYATLTLRAEVRLTDLLSHLYVLVPVLDNRKHYWIEQAEIEKLLRHGDGWLPAHPARDLIVTRYLRYRRTLTRLALEQLTIEEGEGESEEADVAEERAEAPLGLHQQRLNAVAEALKASGAARVLDLGCGEGRLLRLLLPERQFTHVTGLDVSARSLEIAARRLHLDRMGDRARERISLVHGSLVYRDPRLENGFDAAAVVEVVEHLDPWRLTAFERILFRHVRPATVVLTTPNREYNVRFEGMPQDRLRHADHRFEWTRDELAAWAAGVCERHGYTVEVSGVGGDDPEVGAPSQMAVFSR